MNSHAPYPWQEKQWQIGLDGIQNKKLPHAILLSGEAGLGIDTFALQFVQAILCQSEQQPPCQSCHACHLWQTNNHPDYLFLKPKDEKSVIKIDEIRNLIEFLQITSHHQQGKVVLIQNAEAMNRSAANSLLKTLEEPPANVTMVLATPWTSRLLPTIRSRCQIHHFSCPAVEVTQQWLATQLQQDAKEIAIQLSGISVKPLFAYEQLSSKATEQGGQNEFNQDLMGIVNRTLNVVSVAERWSQLPQQDAQQWILSMVSHTIRRILVGELDKVPPLEKLYAFYDRQVQRYQWRNSNLNPQLLLESALLEWQAIHA